jgi:hypothetical protein
MRLWRRQAYMIKNFREITSEIPIAQTWKFLRYYKDTTFVSNNIRAIHNIEEKQHESNVKKQAIQIGFCIDQAEQYFSAASNVGLATKPVMLYYGIVALSQALVLLRSDGSNSLDARRKAKKHQHHGLEIVGNLEEAFRGSLETREILETINCKCNKNKNQTPWGQFPLLYSVLVSPVFAVSMDIHDHGQSTYITKTITQSCSDFRNLEEIADQEFNLLDLVKSMPDMFDTLLELGLQPDLCKGNLKATAIRFYKDDADDKKVWTHTQESHDFFLDGLNQKSKELLLKFYNEINPDIKVQADLGTNLHLVVERDIENTEIKRWYYPDVVEDINSIKYFILKPKDYISEPASFFVFAYALSMLARYYPELWIMAITKNVRFAEFVDTVLNTMSRKYPNLILDQMTGIKHYIHI